MTLRYLLALAVSSLALACSAGAGEGTGSPGTSSGTSNPPGSGSGSGSGSGAGSGGGGEAEYNITCHGDVSKTTPKSAGFDFDLDLQPRCSGGAPGSKCGDPCAAQDVSFWYAPPAYRCLATDIFVWEGKFCVAHSTGSNEGSLHCKGADCENVYKTEAACREARAACLKK